MKTYFKTADGNLFYTHNAAYNHARSLQDKTIVEVDENQQPIETATIEVEVEETTEEVEETTEEVEETTEEVKEATKDVEEAYEITDHKAEETDLTALTNAQLITLAKEKGISVPKRATKEQIIELLTQN
ncbi:MAG: hypothetical protein M9916_02100 [Crocinitomicaceae bacterium]|nr:hypothetical protein [Crocinitomicaceae bacterium]